MSAVRGARPRASSGRRAAKASAALLWLALGAGPVGACGGSVGETPPPGSLGARPLATDSGAPVRSSGAPAGAGPGGAPSPTSAPAAEPIATGKTAVEVAPELAAPKLLAHVDALCAPAWAGRGPGTPGEQAAADYLVQELERSGIAALPPTARRIHEFALPGGKTAAKSRNVLAFIGGADRARASEIVVLGAHYDHVGVRDGAMHPGAEDNASGTAVVLEVARVLARRQDELGRSVLVVFFGAEELGMVGSRAMLRDGVVARDRMVAMVNVDMIGRRLADRAGFGLPLRALGIDAGRSVAVLGTKHRPTLRNLVRESCTAAGIELVVPEELPTPLGAIVEAVARGRADSATFEDAGIPALFFSAGESDDYHAPTDTPDRLEPALLARRAESVLRTVLALSQSPRPIGP